MKGLGEMKLFELLVTSLAANPYKISDNEILSVFRTC